MSDHTSMPHVLPLKLYLVIGFSLLILTVLTVFIAKIPLGGWNLVVALLIASLKAMLVAFFFMHLYYDNKLYFIIFCVAVVTLTTFITLTMFDSLDRGLIYEFKAEPINPKAAMYDKPNFQNQSATARGDTGKAGGFVVPTDSGAIKRDSAGQAKPSGY